MILFYFNSVNHSLYFSFFQIRFHPIFLSHSFHYTYIGQSLSVTIPFFNSIVLAICVGSKTLSVFRSSPFIFLLVGLSLLYLSQSVCFSFFAVNLSSCRSIASLSISVCQSLFLSLLLHCQFLFPFPVRVTINLLL